MKPGEEIIEQGIADLSAGRETIPSLLVSIGAPRLRRLGLPVPTSTILSPEHKLYEVLRTADPYTAHSRYNALIRRLVSFESAAEKEASANSDRGENHAVTQKKHVTPPS